MCAWPCPLQIGMHDACRRYAAPTFTQREPPLHSCPKPRAAAPATRPLRIETPLRHKRRNAGSPEMSIASYFSHCRFRSSSQFCMPFSRF